ncbi:MAG: Fe-S cluster assembly protein SufD [Alphaproteobacteria bacterium]|nr:Fe-S cluster assembly protein SufD [Alphaproteobacteria bacterium]MBV9063469.1 Fe-S cluster assembly protein SufD [Alphaproteobacteria bacterium]
MTALVLPNRRVEDWKYSDLRNAIEPEAVEFAPVATWNVCLSGSVEQNDLPEIMPRAVHGQMGDMAASRAKFGLFLHVAKGQQGAADLQLANPGHGRALIVVEDDAALVLREHGRADGFTNLAVDIVLGPNARLKHIREAFRSEAVRVSDYALRLAAGANYRAHLADFGAKLSRTELHIALEGEGAQADLSGVSVLGDGGHADVTTRVTHASGNTQSTQLFKIIAGGKSRGVYQGKVSVAEGANGTDSRQTAKGLLLGERAEIDLKPELEILADDVKCAHGAAVGDLDPESLFYLRSRGLPEAEARALLMRAFLEDAVGEIADERIRAEVWSRVEAALAELSA